MPNIDTTTIAGFDAMTDAEKVTALLGVEIPEAVDLSEYVKKTVFDAKASEAAALSKRLKAALPAEQAAEEARKQAEEAVKQEMADQKATIAKLEKQITVEAYKNNYIAQGMDAKMAEETAKALADGNMTKVFENQAKHNAALEAKIKADLMNADPKPGGGDGGGKEDDSAIEKARALAKARHGNDKTYNEIMSKYKK